jgi:hypothetical protein
MERVRGRWLLLMVIGAALALALKNNTALWGAIRLRPLGWVLLGAGALVLIWELWSTRQKKPSPPSQPTGTPPTSPTSDVVSTRSKAIQNVGGLIAVAIGVVGVAAIAIVLITTVGGLAKESIVAVATSAFGVISTVVGAFVGIKIGTDQAGKAAEHVDKAAEETANAKAAATAATLQLTDEQAELAKKAVGVAQDIAKGPEEPQDVS